jgi:signal peptidase II
MAMSEKAARRVRTLSRLLCGVIALVIFVSDQVTKAMVERAIPEQTVIPVFPGFFNLVQTKNPGAAFGLFSESPSAWKTSLLIAVSAVLLVTVAALLWKSRKLDWSAGVGMALIVGGALSNLLDRIRLGRVVDFLDVYVGSYHWPTFNLADSAIVIGAGFLVLHVLFRE